MKAFLSSLLLATALITPAAKADGFDSAFDVIEDMGMGLIFSTDGNDARGFDTPNSTATELEYCSNGGRYNSMTGMFDCF